MAEENMSGTGLKNPHHREAYIITGPTSGIGRLTAFELAKHGAVVLVGRDRGKLDEVQKTIEQRGQHAIAVVCNLSDIASVRRAAAEIIALHLPIAGLLNNAGSASLLRPPVFAAGAIFPRRRGCAGGGKPAVPRIRGFSPTPPPSKPSLSPRYSSPPTIH